MGAGSQVSKIGTATVFLLLILSSASAAQLDVTSDSTQWINSGVEISGEYQCQSGQPNVTLTSSGGESFTVEQSSGQFSLSDAAKGNIETGDYTAEVQCEEGPDTEQITVKKMSVSIQSLENKAYKGNSFDVVLGNNQGGFDSSNWEFDSRFVDYGKLETSIVSSGSQVELSVDVPENISSGDKAFVLDWKYKNDVSDTMQPREVTVSPSWKFNVSDVEPGESLAYQNLEELSFDLQVAKKGQKVNDLASEDFYITITEKVNGSENVVDDKQPLLEREWQGNGVYTLTMGEFPDDLELGRYDFRVGLDRNGGIEIANFTVSKYILFSGEITDAGGQPVDGEISVSKDGFSRVIDVKSDGSYSGQVLPGEYNFTLSFPEAKLSLKGVDLSSSRSTVRKGKAVGTIRYDEIPVGEVGKNMQGVTVSNALAVWFGYPFDSGRISMGYDTTKVNPSNLKVFECVGWNLPGVSCYSNSEWSSVEVRNSWIHPTVGTVTFPVTSYKETGSSILYNGYMVVKNTQMELQSVEIGSDRVKTSGTLSVSGKVTTPAEDAISNADIAVKVVDPNSGEVLSTTNATSGAAGTFSGKVQVPGKTGQWDVLVEGERKPYSGFSEEISGAFSTFVQESISMEGPGTVQVVIGQESSSEFTIINDGQAPVNDVSLALRGFNRDWYSFERKSWETLQPGESVTSELRVDLPEDYCEESCQDYETVTVEATGEAGGKVNSLVQIQAQIRKQGEIEGNSTSGNRTESGGLGVPNVGEMTGNFMKSMGTFNIALGMLMVFMLVLAAAVQKKKGDGDRSSRPLSGVSGGSGGGSSGAATASKPDREEMRKSRPDISSSSEEEEESDDESEEEEVEQESKEDELGEETESGEDEASGEESDEVFECGTCGEEFDTESARELHEKAIHE